MANNSAMILTPDVSFADWESELQTALIKIGRLSFVFHEIPEIKPALRPQAPIKEGKSNVDFHASTARYEEELVRWKEGDIEAKDVLLKRLSPNIRPQGFRLMTAKQIFDIIATTWKEGAATLYEDSVRNLLGIKFTTVEEYCDKFMRHYNNVNSATEYLVPPETFSSSTNLFLIPCGLASFLFIMGTEGIRWLDSWRETWKDTLILDEKTRYVSLQLMVSSIRQVVKPTEKVMAGSNVKNKINRNASGSGSGVGQSNCNPKSKGNDEKKGNCNPKSNGVKKPRRRFRKGKGKSKDSCNKEPSTNVAMLEQQAAKKSEQAAKTSGQAAKKSEQAAKTSEQAAKTSEQAAKTSELSHSWW